MDGAKIVRPDWDEYYSDIAQVISRRSNCIKRQIGSLITVDNRIVATGYNGTPRGVRNCFDGGCPRCADSSIPSGTRLDECWCNHAEENAIVQSAYNGIAIKGGTLYTTLSPCLNCAKLIINAGIDCVVYCADYPQNSMDLFTASGRVTLRRHRA